MIQWKYFSFNEMKNTTEVFALNYVTNTKQINVPTILNNITVELLTLNDINKMNEEKLSLQDMNNAEVQRLIPTIVFLLLISVTGITGNSLALYIYKTKLTFSNTQSFVLCLSTIDLFSCCIAIPFEISTVILQQYTFESTWLCKLARFFDTLCANSSSFLLVFIAIERFRKICRPLGWQIKTQVSNFLCVLSIFLGLIVSLPALLVYGRQTFYIPEVNLTGSECSVTDGVKETSLPFMYTLVFGVLFSTAVVVMTTLYCMIGRKLRIQARKINRSLGRETNMKLSLNQIRARKTSLVMFFVTLAFVLSYLPHLTLLLIKLMKNGFIEGLSARNKAAYKFFIRSYFLNCTINPIIYSVWDSRFKAAGKEIITCRSR